MAAKTKFKRKPLELSQLQHLIKIKRNPRDHMFLPVNRDMPHGGYGTYVRLGSIGVKVGHYGFTSKKKLLASSEWTKHKKELENIEKARTLIKSAAPKPYRVFPMLVEFTDAKWKNGAYEYFTKYEWRPAIAMEHIVGVTVGESNNYSLLSQAKNMLQKAKIKHDDLHSANVLVRNKKTANRSHFVIIDWDGKFTKF